MQGVREGNSLVTEVRIHLTKAPPILAFVAVTLWGVVVIHDLRILERHDGSRVVLMPRLRGADNLWTTVAHPIREDTRLLIEQAVLRAFEEAQAERDRPRASA